ncbi:MAG: hypothetical protein IPK26_13555 [Planctomycetes bacterium]|nr:hypothetical protein [Planctomycetota bacterium]
MLLAAASLLLALIGTELALRLLLPKAWFIPNGLLRMYVEQAQAAGGGLQPDDELGHAPVLQGRLYDRFGLFLGQGLPEGAAGKRPGVPRVLFLGDSVTMRGKLVGPLRELWSSGEVEFLNAGVESWNPMQEVAFYFRHQQQLLPDHVVLTLHNNDLTATTTGLLRAGQFTLCTPGAFVPLDPDWYRTSMLYRLLIRARHRDLSTTERYLDHAELVREALRRLRDEVQGRGARLTVLVLPILAAPSAWAPHEQAARQRSLGILHELAIEAIDLLAPLERLAAAGVTVREQPGDSWHPNAACGAHLALAAVQAGLWSAAPPLATASGEVVAVDAPQVLEVSAGPALAGRSFVVLGSLAGIAPAATTPFGRVPLCADAYLQVTLQATAPPFRGVLDGGGRATVRLPVPELAAEGGVVFHAVVVLDGEGQGPASVGRPLAMVVARRQ